MNKTVKIKRTAVIVFIVFSILFFLQTVRKLIRLLTGIGFFTYNFPPPLTEYLNLVLHIGVYILCFLLLRRIMNSDSPFKEKTVGLLKIMALLFISIDIVSAIHTHRWAFQVVSEPASTYSSYVYTGITITNVTTISIWWGGFNVIAGLIIYLIALVLKHGISLQSQVDETL